MRLSNNVVVLNFATVSLFYIINTLRRTFVVFPTNIDRLLGTLSM